MSNKYFSICKAKIGLACHAFLCQNPGNRKDWIPHQLPDDDVRKSRYFITIIILIISFALLTFFLPKAYADSLSLSISPPLLEVMIKPGKSITQTLNLINNGESVIIMPKLTQYTANGVVVTGESIKESWISFLNPDISFGRSFFMEKGQQRQLSLRINPPVGFPEGDYYRAILFSTVENPGIETTHSSVNQSTGSILLVNVTLDGLTRKEAQISRFELPPIIDSFGSLEGNIEVKNTGDTYFRTIGEISLTGPVTRSGFQILPRVILKEESKNLRSEMSHSENEFAAYSFKGFFLGRYDLKVEFTLDEGSIKVSQTKSFIAVPWKLTFFIISAVIIAYVIVHLFKSRLNKR